MINEVRIMIIMINNNDAQNEVLSSYSTFKITLLLYCTVT